MPRTGRRRRSGPRERLGPWWSISKLALYWPIIAIVRVDAENVDELPAQGPVILAVNHVSHVDPLVLATVILDAGRVPRFLAKDSIFRVRVVGRFMHGMGHVPVTRGSVEAKRSLDAAIVALERGHVIMMYPEGTVTRDPDGWPMAPRSGTARLALMSPTTPVIPVGQWGIQQSVDLYRRKVKLFPRPKHRVRFGPRVDLSAFVGAEPSPATLAAMNDVIMQAIRHEVAALRGQPEPTGELYRMRSRRKDA